MKPDPDIVQTAADSDSTPGTAATPPSGSLLPEAPPFPVPDHTLIRRVGRGSYGEVWLARNALGTWRAVKIVRRAAFDNDRPYEREFAGIQRFEPISRSHESQLNILQVGRAENAFYYVMEVADEMGRGQDIDPDTYTPRNLRSELHLHGRLPVADCLRIGLALTTALEHLHKQGLVHRDIKPSNIVFVNGIPKLADIGLVARAEATMSFVGTEGYLPPEGPGTRQADIYSLGKVLYELSTGHDRQQFPELPTNIVDLPDRPLLGELNEVLIKACHRDPAKRYQSAAEMHADLALLESGRSVVRLRGLERRLRFVQRAGAVVTALGAVIALGWWWQARQTDRVATLARENLALAQEAAANATSAKQNTLVARERLYAADINLAHQELLADNLRLARRLLQNHLPLPGQPDLRGFEWRYLWERCRSEELFSIPGHTNHCRVLAVSPDNRRVAVGSIFGSTAILDLASRQTLAVLPRTDWVLSLEFSPDGKQLAIGTPLNVQLWDAHSFTELQRLSGAAAPAHFSPDGHYLVTGKVNAEGRLPRPFEETIELLLWQTTDWAVIRTLAPPLTGSTSSARELYLQPVFSGNSRLAILVGDTIRLFSVPDLEEVLVVPEKLPLGEFQRPFLAVAPDHRTLATVSPSGFGVRLWDLEDNRELRILPGHADHVFDADFSPDGKVLATCSPDQTIKLWEVETGELLTTFRGQADEVTQIAFSPDGQWLVSLGITEGEIKVWDPQFRPRPESLRAPIHPFGFDADGALAAFLAPALRSVVLDPATFHHLPLASPSARDGVAYSLGLNGLSKDGKFQGVWLPDESSLEVWDRHAGKLLCVVPSRSPLVIFAPRRQLVGTFTTNEAGDLITTMWQLPDGTAKWTVPNNFATATISPDEQYLITSHIVANQPNRQSVWQQLHLWRIEGEELRSVWTQTMKEFFVSGAAFSPDGHLAAVAGGEITLRSLPSMEVVGVLKGHTRTSIAVAFSPDSRTLASIADDRTVRLWHVATQRELLRFQAPEQDQRHFFLEFSPDGRSLAAQRMDLQGVITWIYHAPSLAEIAVAEGEDYRSQAADNPFTWLAVAKALQRDQRWAEALEACDEVVQRIENQPELAWLHDRVPPTRVEILRHLGRFQEAGAENCAALGIPARDPATPAEAIDLSAFYLSSLVFQGSDNDLRELPVGPQILAGTVFDVRGLLQMAWAGAPEKTLGIPLERRLQRLHFLHAAAFRSPDVPVGERIGHYQVNYADRTSLDIPIRYHVDTCDWWELDHLPKELPEAVVAWRGANPRSRRDGNVSLRLFKRTWENPHPDLDVISLDFVAEHPRTHPFLVALTAE